MAATAAAVHIGAVTKDYYCSVEPTIGLSFETRKQTPPNAIAGPPNNDETRQPNEN